MYDDGWFNPIPSSVPVHTGQARQRRRESLLRQPHDFGQADTGPVEPFPLAENPTSPTNGPPKATVARRARSYTDFYYAVQAQHRKDEARGDEKEKRRSVDRIGLDSRPDVDDGDDVLSEALLDASHDKYRLYRDQLRLSREHLESLLSNTSANLEVLSALSESFKIVELQTSSFQSRCEVLLAERKRVSDLAGAVSENLQYYNYLEPITKRLNAPGAGNSVRRDDFSEMLAHIDSCLDYMQTHRHHREAETYRSRYRLLLTRALTLIRVHFTNTLREITTDVSKRIGDRQLNDTTMSALLYAKFRVDAPKLKQLALEVEKRAVPPPDAVPGAQGEYQSLMNELYQSYSAARGRLIIPIIRKKMTVLEVAPSTVKDLVAFARSSVSYLRGVCLDEYDLWREWFDGQGALYEFLESVCEPLFDSLRSRIIRETQLSKLCEMCSLLQVRYMEDAEDDSKLVGDDQLDFAVLIRPALEDAQTRLVFLTLAVLRTDIERYKPTAEDLDNPAKKEARLSSATNRKSPALSGRKHQPNRPQTPIPKTPTIVDEEGVDSMELRWRYDAGAAFQVWYPTLRKAMWLLSRIYRLVNSSVFDDLAHQIVHQTTLSLQHASAQISLKATPADSQLFLLRQLLILKQQIVAFDIEFVSQDVNIDFSSITNTFWELRERGGLFNPANLVRLVGGSLMPRVVENMIDAKAELDARLRTTINDFINDFATRMTAAVSEVAISKKDFDVTTAVGSVRRAIETEVPILWAKLDDYLDDERVKDTLVGAVQDQALHQYEAFFDRHTTHARANGNVVSKKGKGRQDDVWDPDTFADWAARVFGMGRSGGDGDSESRSTGASPSGST